MLEGEKGESPLRYNGYGLDLHQWFAETELERIYGGYN